MEQPSEEIIVRVGEIYLKSKPVMLRFLSILENNIRNSLKKEGLTFTIYKRRFRFYIKAENPEKACAVISLIPGIVSFSKAYHLNTSDLETIKKFCAENYASWISEKETFAVRSKRVGDQAYLSKDVEFEVGSVIDRKVNLTHPDKTVFVEIIKDDTHIFSSSGKGVGGLPVGSSGRILSMLSGGIDSPVSSFLMMKRGCAADLLHFHSFPLVSTKSLEKAKDLAKALNKIQLKITLHLVPFSDYQMAVKAGAEQRLRVILYRRGMLKIANKIAEKEGIKCICTGESLAQVSSQTIDNLFVTDEASKIPVLRPLIGLDKEEIIEISKKLHTYEISIQPHEDCCTLFVPEHASASTKLNEIKAIEKKLKLTPHITKAIKKTEKIEIK